MTELHINAESIRVNDIDGGAGSFVLLPPPAEKNVVLQTPNPSPPKTGGVIALSATMNGGEKVYADEFGNLPLVDVSVIYTAVTKTELDSLIATSTLIPGVLYRVLVHPNLYDDGVSNLTPAFLMASTTNKLNLQGHGLFHNPKYNQADTNSGIWTSGAAYTQNVSKVAWGGYMWLNISGSAGSAVNRKTLDGNWQKISFNALDYNVVLDTIHYEYITDNIVMREDAIGNRVEAISIHNSAMQSSYGLTAISAFQWGNKAAGLYNNGTFNNKILNSFFEGINLKGVVNNNELREWCSFINNTVAKDGEFTFNIIENRCTLQNNTIAALTGITDNHLNFYCTISGNNLGQSAYGIRHNKLDSQSTINNNVFSGAASGAQGVRQNTLDIVSTINNNTMNTHSTIYLNDLMVNAHIDGNTMSSPNVGQNAYIYKNTLSDASISSNQINGSVAGNMPSITNNNLKGGNWGGAHIFPAAISNNNITGDARIEFNSLAYSTMQNMSTNQDVKNFNLNSLVYNFNNVVAATQTNYVSGDSKSLVFPFTKTFTGAAGAGDIGAVILPVFNIPTGFFIEEVLVDVGIGLTDAGGAIFNLGIATDGPTSGLDNINGVVANLNSYGVSRFQMGTAGFTKATALRALVMSVTTAAVTGGTATFIIRLAKLG